MVGKEGPKTRSSIKTLISGQQQNSNCEVTWILCRRYEGSSSQAFAKSREGRLNVGSELCDRGYYFSYYRDQMSIRQGCSDALFRGYCSAHQGAVSAGPASAWCPWMMIPHITENYEAESARCCYPAGFFRFPFLFRLGPEHGMVLHTFRTGLLPPWILSGKTQVDTPKVSDSNLPDKFKYGDIFYLASPHTSSVWQHY